MSRLFVRAEPSSFQLKLYFAIFLDCDRLRGAAVSERFFYGSSLLYVSAEGSFFRRRLCSPGLVFFLWTF